MANDLSNEAKLARCQKALSQVLLHNQDIAEAIKTLIDAVERHAPDNQTLKAYVGSAKIAIGVDPTGRGVMIWPYHRACS